MNLAMFHLRNCQEGEREAFAGFSECQKLTKGNIKPISTIYVDHGKVSIDELNWMTMTVLIVPR